jgi:hypothetical protein
MAVERVLSNLNLISFKTEGGLQNHIDELQDGDLVFTPDNSLKGNLFDFKWTDHKLNDISWLNADTFSWQSGDVYVAAYNHLVADFEGTVAETTTIDGIEITYYLADDKHIICLPDQEDKVLELYNKTGVAWYYILDTANKQFKLPRTNNLFKHYVPDYSQSKTISSGWVAEYDCVCFLCNSWENSVDFKVDGKQVHRFDGNGGYGHPTGAWFMIPKGGKVTYSGAFVVSPTVYPMKSVSELDEVAGEKYLYFYVGNFEQSAIEQTAGITSEQLNNKADVNLGNIPENYDYVVASQEPTSANGYTWYRKYKSGWVEQGGKTTSATSTVALPIEMADTNYHIQATPNGTGGTSYYASFGVRTSTTTVTIYGNSVGSWWQVSGMAQ